MAHADDNHLPGFAGKPLTRREVLKGALAVGAGAAFAPALAACGGGSSASSASPSPSTAASPKKGGNLRVGISGGSAKESLDGQVGTTEPEVANAYQLYDALLGWDVNDVAVNRLAEEVSVSPNAQVWTVRVRKDAVFHDGKPVTADDVIFSYNRVIDPKAPKVGAGILNMLKSSGIRKIDDRTVRFTLETPDAVFNEAMANLYTAIIPVGYDPKTPIGTGPFKLKSFLPGQQIVYVPNENYFDQVPAVDELTLIEFTDTAARVNALLGGTVDAISELPPAQVAVIKGNSGLRVLDTHGGGWQPFTMRIDQKPFNDVRVRQAFRLIVDRKQMIEQAYDGFGWEGNDMYGPFDPGYPKNLPQREQDLEKAKSLLKAAGYDNNLTITLNTSDAVGSGAVAASQVFAQQAKGAGVTVNVNKLDPSIFYGTQYLKWVFAQDFFYTHNYLAQAGEATMPTAAYNATHWKDAEWLALVQEALRTSDKAKRDELVGEAETIEYNIGGNIVWAFNDAVDAYAAKLGGVVPDKYGAPLSSWHFNRFYFI
jgi:peptide/nickel transport system substrate-binding protein